MERSPNHPEVIISPEVDAIFAEFRRSENSQKLDDLMIRLSQRAPLNKSRKRFLDGLYAGMLFEEIVRFRPEFWLEDYLKTTRFLSQEDVEDWYRKHSITKGQFDGLLVDATGGEERIVAFLEYSLYDAPIKFKKKYETFRNHQREVPRDFFREPILIVVTPDFKDKVLHRIEKIAEDIEVRPLPFTPREFAALKRKYDLTSPLERSGLE